ncbi:MAG: Flp family type IVb pilin [Phycisphaerales bacterium]|nr:Flp family type IVb pilin [Phycisphaerales bacterium]
MSNTKPAWLRGLLRLCHEEDGPTATEYAVMLALIVVGAIAAITQLTARLQSMFGAVQQVFDDANQP